MKNLALCCMLLLATLVFTQSAKAQPEIKWGYLPTKTLLRGTTTRVGVVADVPEGYYFYADNKSKYAQIEKPKFVVSSIVGLRFSPVIYPSPKKNKIDSNVFKGRVVFYFDITVPENTLLGKSSILVDIYYRACSDEVDFKPENDDFGIPLYIDTPTKSNVDLSDSVWVLDAKDIKKYGQLAIVFRKGGGACILKKLPGANSFSPYYNNSPFKSYWNQEDDAFRVSDGDDDDAFRGDINKYGLMRIFLFGGDEKGINDGYGYTGKIFTGSDFKIPAGACKF